MFSTAFINNNTEVPKVRSPELSNKFLDDADAGGSMGHTLGTTISRESVFFQILDVSDLGSAKPLNFRDHQTTT